MKAARVAVVIAAVGAAIALAWRVSPQARGSHASSAKIYLPGAASADGPAPSARAPGCGKRHHRPVGESLETSGASGGRTFHVWGPNDYDASKTYPIVLAFHGWSSNGRAFQKWFEMEKYVDGAAFVAYADSRGPQWDYSGTKDTDFAAAMIDQLAESWCVDRARVLAVGFSYGARFVNHLGCTRSDLVRAIVAGGGAWDDETGCKPMPVLVIHRPNDPSMSFARGKEAAARWAKVDGCSTDVAVVDREHGCTAFRVCTKGAVTFCEDSFVDSSWPNGWNHTIRDEYRSLAWSWFLEVP